MHAIRFLIRMLVLWGLCSVLLIYTIAGSVRAVVYGMLVDGLVTSDQLDLLSNSQAVLITKLIILSLGLIAAIFISSWIEKDQYIVRDLY